MSKRQRRTIINAVFFAVMASTIWFIGWFAILGGFCAAVAVGTLMPSAREDT